jgi:hypothetical protein
MGLTGVILRAGIQLRRVESAWIKQTIVPAYNLMEAIEAFENLRDTQYCVAWLDCQGSGDAIGRSLILVGEHVQRENLPQKHRSRPYTTPARNQFSVPFNAPLFALTGAAIKIVNELYFRRGVRTSGTKLIDWDSYFYPLDRVLEWNRLYGRKGLLQFQCVLPLGSSHDGIKTLLHRTSALGEGSYLATLKRLGPQESKFSFPTTGYTLTLDFPATRKSFALLSELDRITVEYGGRFYLAKDSRMTAETLRQSDDRVERFLQMRIQNQLVPSFSSVQSERLHL